MIHIKGFSVDPEHYQKWFTPKAPNMHWKLEDSLSKDISEPDKCYTDKACIKRDSDGTDGKSYVYKNLKTDKDCYKDAVNNEGWICQDLGIDDKGEPIYKMIAQYDENKNIFKKRSRFIIYIITNKILLQIRYY